MKLMNQKKRKKNQMMILDDDDDVDVDVVFEKLHNALNQIQDHQNYHYYWMLSLTFYY